MVRLDRLARSVSHSSLSSSSSRVAGAHFRSLRDPTDTTTPQGMFSFQVLGAVASSSVIAERTKAGCRRRAAADASAAIPACAPAAQKPSARSAPGATRHDELHEAAVPKVSVYTHRKPRWGFRC